MVVEMRFGSQKKTTDKNPDFFWGGIQSTEMSGNPDFIVLIEHSSQTDFHNHINVRFFSIETSELV